METLLGHETFEACIRMFVGAPQPLWAYGKHHSGKKLWTPIIRAIAADPGHRLFAATFDDTLSFADEATIEAIVGRMPADELPKAFAAMLAAKVRTVGDWHCEARVSLLERGELAGLLDDWLCRIDQKLHGILEDVRDSKQWLASSRFAKQVHEMLRADLTALTELHRMLDVVEMIEAASQAEERTEANVTLALSMLFDEQIKRIDANPPRLHGTWSRIVGLAKEFNASGETKDRIEVQRLAAIERHREFRGAEKDDDADVMLEGWVNLAQDAPCRATSGMHRIQRSCNEE